MTRQEYPIGLDCVWVASDRDRRVAAFVTAGVGPIPTLVLNDTELLLVADIAVAIRKMPKVSGCHLLVSVPRPDSFIKMAERGFFVYDWSDIHRISARLINAYEPMAYPLNPISLDELPESLRSHASSVRYNAGAFQDGECIKLTDYFDCLSGESNS